MTNPSATNLTYTDFYLDLHRTEQNDWRICLRSPNGDHYEDHSKLALPPNAVAEAMASVAYTTGYLRRSSQRHQGDPLVSLGKALFRCLMEHTELGRLYAAAQENARHQQRILRLRLSTSDPSIDLLPWEFLFDPEAYQPDFIVLSAQTELVRQWGDLLHPTPGLELPVRLLLVTTTETALDAQSEIDALLNLAPDPKLLTIEVVKALTKRDLLNTLRQQTFQMLHVIGAGAPQNGSSAGQPGLLMVDKTQPSNNGRRTAELVSTQELNDSLRNQSNLGIVIISGCHTEMVARDLTTTAPATLGSRGTMTDAARVALMTTLYQALLAGKPLDLAVAEGQLAIDRQTPGSREWGLPTLYIQAAQCPQLAVRPATSASTTNCAPTLAPLGLTLEQQTLLAQLEIEQINLAQLQQLQAVFGDPTPAYLTAEIAMVQAKIDQWTAISPVLI